MQSGIKIMGQANANYRYSDFFFFYRTKIKEKKSNYTEVNMLKNDFLTAVDHVLPQIVIFACEFGSKLSFS